jgi:hypothetical protein
MMNFNYRLLPKICLKFYQSHQFSSVVKGSMSLNQLKTANEPTPAYAEHHSINAFITAKQMLALTAKATPMFLIFQFVHGNERCRNSVPSPDHSRRAPTKFGQCDRAFTSHFTCPTAITNDVIHIMIGISCYQK